MTLKLAERLAESQTWLDAVSDGLQPVVRKAVAGTGRRGADLLDGVWLGAPLHPALTDVPIGALTAAVTLDGVATARDREPSTSRRTGHWRSPSRAPWQQPRPGSLTGATCAGKSAAWRRDTAC